MQAVMNLKKIVYVIGLVQTLLHHKNMCVCLLCTVTSKYLVQK